LYHRSTELRINALGGGTCLGREEFYSIEKAQEKGFQWREVTHHLLVSLYKACFDPSNDNETMLRVLVSLVYHVIHVLADAHNTCKVLIRGLGGFHALA